MLAGRFRNGAGPDLAGRSACGNVERMVSATPRACPRPAPIGGGQDRDSGKRNNPWTRRAEWAF